MGVARSRRQFITKAGAVAGTLAAATAPGLLTGCSHSVSLGSNGKSDRIEVLWDIPTEVPVLNHLATQYAQKYPDFKVHFRSTTAAAAKLVYQHLIKTKKIPVLLNPAGDSDFAFEQAGLLAPWDGYFNRPDPYMGKRAWKDVLHTEWLLHANWTDGKLYRLPYYADEAGIYYNKAIFQELGLSAPTRWDHWLQINGALKKSGHSALGWSGAELGVETWFEGFLGDSVFRHLEPRLVQAGMMTAPKGWRFDPNNSFNDAHIKLNANWNYYGWKKGIIDFGGDEVRYMFERMAELVPFFQPNFTGYKAQDVVTAFAQGRIATFFGAGWQLPALENVTKTLPPGKRFEVGEFEIPSFQPRAFKPHGMDFLVTPMRPTTGSGSTSTTFSLSAEASEKDRLRAVDFVQFVTSARSASYEWNKITLGEYPITKDVPNLPAYARNPPKGGASVLSGLGYTAGIGNASYANDNFNKWTEFALGKISLTKLVSTYDRNFNASYKAYGADPKNNVH